MILVLCSGSDINDIVDIEKYLRFITPRGKKKYWNHFSGSCAHSYWLHGSNGTHANIMEWKGTKDELMMVRMNDHEHRILKTVIFDANDRLEALQDIERSQKLLQMCFDKQVYLTDFYQYLDASQHQECDGYWFGLAFDAEGAAVEQLLDNCEKPRWSIFNGQMDLSERLSTLSVLMPKALAHGIIK